MPTGPATETVLKMYQGREFTEIPLDGMRRTIAARLTEAKLLAAIIAQGWEARLGALQTDQQSDPDLARLIVAAWYSGLVTGKSGDVLAGYENALVFQNVSFMHVLGNCGGDFGYWAEKP